MEKSILEPSRYLMRANRGRMEEASGSICHKGHSGHEVTDVCASHSRDTNSPSRELLRSYVYFGETELPRG